MLLGCLRQVVETNASRRLYSLLKQSGNLSRNIAELHGNVACSRLCLVKQEEQEQLVNHHYSVARICYNNLSAAVIVDSSPREAI